MKRFFNKKLTIIFLALVLLSVVPFIWAQLSNTCDGAICTRLSPIGTSFFNVSTNQNQQLDEALIEVEDSFGVSQYFTVKNNGAKDLFIPHNQNLGREPTGLKEFSSFVNATKAGRQLEHDPVNGKDGVKICLNSELAANGIDIDGDGTDDIYGCGCESVTDNRDNKVYNTVELNGTCWFADPLQYNDPSDGGTPKDTYTTAELYDAKIQAKIDNNTTYNNSSANICPNGWRVPTDNDWVQLELDLGMAIGTVATWGGYAEDVYPEGAPANLAYNFVTNRTVYYNQSVSDTEEFTPTTAITRNANITSSNNNFANIDTFLGNFYISPGSSSTDKKYFWTDDITNVFSGGSVGRLGRIARSIYPISETTNNKQIGIERLVLQQNSNANTDPSVNWVNLFIDNVFAMPDTGFGEVRCVKEPYHTTTVVFQSAANLPMAYTSSFDGSECNNTYSGLKALRPTTCRKNNKIVHPANCAEYEFLEDATPFDFADASFPSLGLKVDVNDGKEGLDQYGYWWVDCAYTGNVSITGTPITPGSGNNPGQGTGAGNSED